MVRLLEQKAIYNIQKQNTKNKQKDQEANPIYASHCLGAFWLKVGLIQMTTLTNYSMTGVPPQWGEL